MDTDIQFLTREELKTEIRKLRTGIRMHRDAKGHNRCHINNTALYSLLPEQVAIDPLTLNRVDFLQRCEEYYDEETK